MIHFILLCATITLAISIITKKRYQGCTGRFSKCNKKKLHPLKRLVSNCQALPNLGLCYLDLNKLDSAAYCLNTGLALARKKRNDLVREMYCYNNLGLLNIETGGDWSQAVGNFKKKAILIAEQITFPHEIANCWLNIVQVYIKSERYDSALYNLEKSCTTCYRSWWHSVEQRSAPLLLQSL